MFFIDFYSFLDKKYSFSCFSHLLRYVVRIPFLKTTYEAIKDYQAGYKPRR